jgi:hypothetical protein
MTTENTMNPFPIGNLHPDRLQNDSRKRPPSLPTLEGRSDLASQIQSASRPSQDADEFTPTHAFYIRRHNQFSKNVKVINLTSEILNEFLGGDIPDSFRNRAYGLADEQRRINNPAYIFARRHWWSRDVIMYNPRARPKSQAEVASYTEPIGRIRQIAIRFPPHSEHEDLIYPGGKCTWWQGKYRYEWRSNTRISNNSSLVKLVGKKEVVVAKYMQHWGGSVGGGLVLVDGGLLDEAVVILSAVVMLSPHRLIGDMIAVGSGSDRPVAEGVVALAGAVGGG